MYNMGSSSPTLINCTFTRNTTDYIWGGAMYNRNTSNATLINCTFTANSGQEGGGMANHLSNPTLVNCTFSANSGDGRALYNYSASPTLTNCILWDGGNEIVDLGDSSSTVTYSNVAGGWPGAGNIDADPLFVDADGPDDIPGNEDDDLRLAFGSPCIDAADDTAVPADLLDLDGDGNMTERIPIDLAGHPRFVDDPDAEDTGVPDPPDYEAVVDMGAYESQGAECLGDGDCDDGEACTEDTCNTVARVCVATYHRRLYGDVTPFGSIVPPCTDEDRRAMGDGFANMLDVFGTFNAFSEGAPYTQCPCADVSPCVGDGFVNMLDVFAIFNAFNGSPSCPDPCP